MALNVPVFEQTFKRNTESFCALNSINSDHRADRYWRVRVRVRCRDQLHCNRHREVQETSRIHHARARASYVCCVKRTAREIASRVEPSHDSTRSREVSSRESSYATSNGAQRKAAAANSRRWKPTLHARRSAQSPSKEPKTVKVESQVDESAVVYFVQADSPHKLIKIGQSTDFAARFAALCNDNACNLKILGVIPHRDAAAARIHEAELHTRFSSHRHHGGWYFPREPLQNFIIKNVVNVPASDAASATRDANEVSLDEWFAQDYPEALMTVEEVAELLGVRPITIRRQVARRLMPCIYVGKRLLRFDRRDVIRSPLALGLRQHRRAT